MSLKEFLESQIKEKKLTAKEIERRSNGKITDTHIGYILSGKSRNPTVRIIVGLAEALDIDPVEVFKIATGVEVRQEALTTHSLARMIDAVVDNSELAKLVQILTKQKPAKIKALLRDFEPKASK